MKNYLILSLLFLSLSFCKADQTKTRLCHYFPITPDTRSKYVAVYSETYSGKIILAKGPIRYYRIPFRVLDNPKTFKDLIALDYYTKPSISAPKAFIPLLGMKMRETPTPNSFEVTPIPTSTPTETPEKL